MTTGVVFTLDLEDRRSDPRAEPRFRNITEDLLAFLAERGAHGTVFVVGDLASEYPDLVRAIAAAGHEVGLHGLRHTYLAASGATRLAEELKRGKALVEELTQRPCEGFRAPYFSLVPGTPWAPDVILEAGFEYSSSVMPARTPVAGFPGAPLTPFAWSNGLVELPCPVARVGPALVPYMGGAYMRLLPGALVQRLARRSGPGDLKWVYSHPYDFDPGEPFHVMPGTSRWQSRLLWLNRHKMYDRVDLLLGDGAGAPLQQVVRALDAASLPVFSH